MIAASAGVKVMVATKPVDFRRGADALAALVREQLHHDPFLCVGRKYVAAWRESVQLRDDIWHCRHVIAFELVAKRDLLVGSVWLLT